VQQITVSALTSNRWRNGKLVENQSINQSLQIIVSVN